ncbi:J domain-containing protein [Gillisia hiemivivida]
MSDNLPAFSAENKELTRKLELLHLDFLEHFTRHKDMVENESDILTSLYLEKLGRLQLELLEKQTEASRLKMKMKLMQAAINRDEQPDLKAIEQEINTRLQNYYAQIQAQSAALEEAKKMLSHLISEEETQKLKEIFRVLCKRLHPDLNPNQTEKDKDLFIKVKAAYDLQRLSVLQNTLLYLDDPNKEKLLLISSDEKVERIKHLENKIISLRAKIDQLKQSFPFSMEALILDEDYIVQKQEELRIQIKTCEEEIVKYSNIINIMADE